MTIGCFYKNIHTESPVSSRLLNFCCFVGRIKCPAYIGCGDTPTKNTNLVNLTTELEMSIFFFLFFFFLFLCVCTGTFHGLLKGYFNINFKLECFKIHYSFCVCVFILVVLQEGLITAYTRKMVPIKNERVHSL